MINLRYYYYTSLRYIGIAGNAIGVRRVLVHVTLYKYYCCCCCCCCYKRFAAVQYPNMHDLQQCVYKRYYYRVDIYATTFRCTLSYYYYYYFGVCATARRPQNDRFVFTRAHTPWSAACTLLL